MQRDRGEGSSEAPTPDSLASMSWKSGEPFGRPRQHMIMSVVNVFTSMQQPLLKEDYTHLFKGTDHEAELTKAWKNFQGYLQEEIDRRNEKRRIKNINMSGNSASDELHWNYTVGCERSLEPRRSPGQSLQRFSPEDCPRQEITREDPDGKVLYSSSFAKRWVRWVFSLPWLGTETAGAGPSVTLLDLRKWHGKPSADWAEGDPQVSPSGGITFGKDGSGWRDFFGRAVAPLARPNAAARAARPAAAAAAASEARRGAGGALGAGLGICAALAQGNDRGTQYRSGLYYFNEDQKRLFEASKVAYEAALQGANRGRGPITTEILASADFEDKVFYYAEDYHQQYLAKPRARPYCSAQPQVVPLPSFESWCPEDLQEKYRPKLPEEFWQQHGPSPHCVIMAPNEPILWP
ncbi:unnamed protein product [Effrenium voratum]|nr:unnamed protein product [Effrenium voratum]